MDKNESIEEVLEKMDKNIIYKKKKLGLQSILICLLGIVTLVINAKFVSRESGFVSPLLMMTGFIAVIWGVFSYVFRKSYFAAASNHQRLALKEIYFNANERDKLVRLVEN